MNELSIVMAMTLAAILWAAVSYSVGYKEGERVGFTRGRAISRHAAKGKARIDMDAFWASVSDRNKAVK